MAFRVGNRTDLKDVSGRPSQRLMLTPNKRRTMFFVCSCSRGFSNDPCCYRGSRRHCVYQLVPGHDCRLGAFVFDALNRPPSAVLTRIPGPAKAVLSPGAGPSYPGSGPAPPLIGEFVAGLRILVCPYGRQAVGVMVEPVPGVPFRSSHHRREPLGASFGGQLCGRAGRLGRFGVASARRRCEQQ